MSGETMNRTLAVLAAALIALASPAHAGIDKAGTTSANFLSVGSGASVLGMGGATLGWAGDLSAASWNPGALGFLNETEMMFSHAGLAAESSQEWASVGGGFGSHTRWSMSGLYQGVGSIEGRDAFNNPIGTLSASSMAFGVHGAQALSPNVSVGLGFKYVAELLAGVSGSGLGVDAGVSLRSGPIGFGVAAQNLGGKVRYDGGSSYAMPQNVGAGASYTDETHGLRFALDANFPNAYYNDVRAGVEWRRADRFALRTGYRMELNAASAEPLTGPTFGMGAGVNGFWFDYGFVLGGNGESQHRIGLTFRPGMMNLGATTSGVESTEPAKQPKSEPASPKPTKKSAETTAANAAPATTAAGQANDPYMPKPSKKSAAAATATGTAAATVTGTAAANATPKTPATQNAAPATPGTVTPAPTAAKSGTGATTATKTSAGAAVAAPAVAAPIVAAPKPPDVATSTAPATQTTKPAETAASPKTSDAATTTSATPSSVAAAPKSVAEVPKAATAAPVAAAVATGTVATAPKTAVETPKTAAEMTQAAAETAKPAAEITKPAAPPATAEAQKSAADAPKTAPATEGAKTAEVAKKAETTKAVETTKAAETAKAAPAPKTEPAKPRPAYVQLKKGQTLDDVAREWGVSVTSIMMENNLTTQKNVKPGTKIKLPPQR
jgi:hypothetical protein